ncbi:MAG: hypothetical protein J6A29_06925 [Clostridia bacterium]|nr:hypothetical protein [Clostridia bacterium]
MDGIYEIKVNTPMGLMSGKIYLKQTGNLINGTLEIMGMKNNLTGGRVQGNRCCFSGEFKNNALNIKYDIAAELEGYNRWREDNS